MIVDEGVRRFGATAELSALIYEHAFDDIDAPVMRIGAGENPMPFSPPLEQATIPQTAQIVAAVQETLGIEQKVAA